MATLDALTNLLNRRALYTSAQTELNRSVCVLRRKRESGGWFSAI